MKDAVSRALDEMRAVLSATPFCVREDAEGGVFVILDDLPLGAPYLQESTWCGFHIPFSYPFADCYPHFVRGDLSRMDTRPLGEAMSPGAFEGRSAIQISRRSNRLNPATDTALLKLQKVMAWLRSRP